MTGLKITDLGVYYGGPKGFRALSEVSLNVESGTFVTLLGPSGSGKTSLLRCVAGLVKPSEGRIEAGPDLFFDATSGTGLLTRQRKLGMVFQAFALWPHMTVTENVGFPLRMRGWSRSKRQGRVEELLELVGLPKMGGRFPSQLSGGQQQRVGLARAISGEPSLLLMDEPLSGLDARLREEMRSYIRRLQKELGITVIYVTHDREEALCLSDQIVILSRGRVMSVGTPQQLYRQPTDAFTANFLAGWNLLGGLDGILAGGGTWLNGSFAGAKDDSTTVVLPTDFDEPLDLSGIAGDGFVPAIVTNIEYLGGSVRLELRMNGVQGPVFVSQSGETTQKVLALSIGTEIGLPMTAFRTLPAAKPAEN